MYLYLDFWNCAEYYFALNLHRLRVLELRVRLMECGFVCAFQTNRYHTRERTPPRRRESELQNPTKAWGSLVLVPQSVAKKRGEESYGDILVAACQDNKNFIAKDRYSERNQSP